MKNIKNYNLYGCTLSVKFNDVRKAHSISLSIIDFRSQTGASAIAGAISAAVTFVSAKHRGATNAQAMKESLIQAAKTIVIRSVGAAIGSLICPGIGAHIGGAITGGVALTARIIRLLCRKNY